MSRVRFAVLCDNCGQRSEEYGYFPVCFECQRDICPECGEMSFYDEERGRILCKQCYKEALASNEDEEVDRILQEDLEEANGE